MEIITRAQAHAAGHTHFFTGRVCKNGHVGPRYVSTGSCVACLRQFSGSFSPAKAPGLTTVPAQQVHEDDVSQVYAIIDYLNAARGLPLAQRAGVDAKTVSEFEKYLSKEMRKPVGLRPSLESIESAAIKHYGLKVEYVTMPRPVDDWSPTAEQLQARATQQRRQAAADLERDGYLPDELPDHLTKRP